jgi:hypothetical protein
MIDNPNPVDRDENRRRVPTGRRALLLVTITGLTIGLGHIQGADDKQPKTKVEYYHSFKEHAQNNREFKLMGPNAGERVKFEPGGLRLTFPAGMPEQRAGTGVLTTFGVRGDFEITISFEILQQPKPEETIGQTRLSLALSMDQPARNMATCSRMILRQYGNQFAGWMTRWDEAAGKPRARFDRVPAQALTGRLRMVRSGATLFHDVAEGDDAEFTRIAEHPFGDDDLQDVRIAAATGGPEAALDVRVLDLRIRADSLTNTPAAATAVAPAKASLPWALIAGLAVTIGVILCLWGYLLIARRNRRHRASSARADGGFAPTSVSFPCSGCGKKLKTTPDLAGKMAKCPSCNQAMLVPDVGSSVAGL